MRDMEIQKIITEHKYHMKIKLEELKHRNIIEEIKALEKAKIKCFGRI